MVAPGFVRHLRDEGLHGEGVRNVGHGTEPADARMGLRFRRLDPHIADIEGLVDGGHVQFRRLFALGLQGERGCDGRRGAAVQPRHDLAIGIQAAFQVLVRDRVEVIVAQIVLARPCDLDGFAVHGLRQQRGFGGEVRLGFAAEAAAQQGDVDLDVFGLDLQVLGDDLGGGLRGLHARPDFALAVLDARHGGGRLHGGMREVGQVVLGLHPPGRGGQGRHGVAVVARHLAGLLHQLAQVGLVGIGIVAAVGAVVPVDLQGLAALDQRPRCWRR